MFHLNVKYDPRYLFGARLGHEREIRAKHRDKPKEYTRGQTDTAGKGKNRPRGPQFEIERIAGRRQQRNKTPAECWREHDAEPDVGEFTRLGLLTVPLALVGAVLALWLMLRTIGG